MSRLIGLVGYAQSGKDTVASFMPDVTRVAFADPLREMMARLNPLVCVRGGWHPYKDADYEHYNVLVRARSYEWVKENTNARDFMVALGAGARETIDPNVWVKAGKRRIEQALDEGRHVVVTDVRYLNEAMTILVNGGGLVYVDRPGVGPANEEEERSIAELRKRVDMFTLTNGDTLEGLETRVRLLIGLGA